MATIGRVQEIGTFIRALAFQTYKNYELIIIDQNTDDRLIPVIHLADTLGIPLVHIKQAFPNLSLARNTGLEHSQGDIVAFPDDDCWYEPDVLEKIDSRMNDPDTPEGVVIRWEEQDPVGCTPHLISKALWQGFRSVKTSSIALFFKRRLLVDLHGFDENLGLHSWYGGGEEIDLMFRVIDSGRRIAYIPDALVHHPVHKKKKIPFLDAFFQTRKRARGTGALYAKNRLNGIIIMRGFLSPWYYAARNMFSPTIVGKELGNAVGRVEGYCRWLLTNGQIKK